MRWTQVVPATNGTHSIDNPCAIAQKDPWGQYVAGTYVWTSTFTGDARTGAFATSVTDVDEQVAFANAPLGVTTVAHQATRDLLRGSTVDVWDAATVTGFAPVGSTISFSLYRFDDAAAPVCDAANDACSQIVGDDKDANMRTLEGAVADTATVRDLSTQLRVAAATLRVSTTTAKFDVAREGYVAKKGELATAMEGATATATSLAGQVADQAALDALTAAVKDAQALVDKAIDDTDRVALDDAADTFTAALAKITDAATAAAASHQAWADAQAAAAAAAAAAGGSGGTTGHLSGGRPSGGTAGGGGSTGGGTSGGSTGGGSSGGGGAGVVTWSTCDGNSSSKYIDGEFSGESRRCTTVAFASAAVAPYQNPGNGTCAVVGSRTSDSNTSLVSKASEYTYGRFTFSQANDYQVTMTIESCLAPWRLARPVGEGPVPHGVPDLRVSTPCGGLRRLPKVRVRPGVC